MRSTIKRAIEDESVLRTLTILAALWSGVQAGALLMPGTNFNQPFYAGFRVLPFPFDREEAWACVMILSAVLLWASAPGSRTMVNSLIAFGTGAFWSFYGIVLVLGAASQRLGSANGAWSILIGCLLLLVAAQWPRFR